MKTNYFTKFFTALFVGVAMFTVYSCSTDKDEPLKEPPTLSITMLDGKDVPSVLTIQSEEETVSLSISSNSTWKVSKKGDDTDWLTVTPSEGSKDGEIKITASRNPEIDEREVTLSFSAGDKENFKSLKVLQKGYGPALFVSHDVSEAVSYSGADVTFSIDANNDGWEYSIDNNPDWIIEKEKTESSLVLTVNKNTGDERTALITFKLTDYPSITKEVELKQEMAPLPSLTVSPKKVVMVGYSEDEIVFTIDSGVNDWEYSLTNSSDWLTEESKTDTELTFKVAENTSGAERKVNIIFSLSDMSDITEEILITQSNNELAADLLDVVFKEDGTAEDISPSKREIETLPDEITLNVLYSDKYERYIARFKGDGGTSYSGFYKVHYRDDHEFKTALESGYTLEAVFMNDLESLNQSYCILSSTQGGGTALMLSPNDGTHQLRFLASINKSNWGWVSAWSGVTPEKGTYFHLVGVWNKEKAEMYIYVNGELKETVPTDGHYVHPWEGEAYDDKALSHWFGIGADPDREKGEQRFSGDIVIARIYSDALSAEDVTELWNRVKKY